MPVKFDDAFFDMSSGGGTQSSEGREEAGGGEDKTERAQDEAPSPPPINAMLQSTRMPPASQSSHAVSAAGGGLASDEDNLTLPVHTMDIDRLRPMLTYLLYAYDVDTVRQCLQLTIKSIKEKKRLYTSFFRRTLTK